VPAGKDASAGSLANSMLAKFNNGSLSETRMPRKTRRAGVNDFSYDAVGLFKGNDPGGCETNTILTPRASPFVSFETMRTPVVDGMGKVDVVFVVEIYPSNNVMQTSLLNRT